MSRLYAVLGPTASGKSELAVALAQSWGADVMSVDSMQVYRGMDIGTAKPTLDERNGVVHHMIDVAEPEEEFSVAEFRSMARRVLDDSPRPVVITGGSGLHFRAIVDPMRFAPSDSAIREALEVGDVGDLVIELLASDPGAGNHVDLANRRRVIRALEILRLTGETPTARAASPEAARVREYAPEREFTAVGVDPGPALDARIQQRLANMLESGLVEEVERLWPQMGRTARGAVGYQEIGSFLDGKRTLDEATRATARSTRHLARRQRTWFRRDPRIVWIGWTEDPEQRLERVVEAFR